MAKTQKKSGSESRISSLRKLCDSYLHRMSQPVTALNGFVELLGMEVKEGDPCFSYIRLLEEQSGELKELLQDAMRLLRHENIQKKNADILKVLKKAQEVVSDAFRFQGVGLDMPPEQGEAWLETDETYLQKMLVNLLLNFLQAFDGVSPQAEKQCLELTSRGQGRFHEIKITFSDEALRNKVREEDIFDPFLFCGKEDAQSGLDLYCELLTPLGGSLSLEDQGTGVLTLLLPLGRR